ncbi:tRNA lysidine(34) synthetase TilS [Candidatus Fermentibacteria bacterium]|nr:MAG: tRNA lysidine(34) synthetase TilS [Candidatus Fermentibacteria bacterium]
MSGLERVFLETISRENLLPAGKDVFAAVSGGADSVAMLHLLARFASGRGWNLSVLHVNHGLRNEADDDEAFVRNLAEHLGVPCKAFYPDAEESGSIESRWSRVRQNIYSSLEETVAVAHNSDDRAETVLLRLFEGAGLRGLGGMDYTGVDGVVRPMLDLGREEIREWLQASGLQWREDLSNGDTGISRNRLRLNVMPVVQKNFPEAVRGICRSGSVLSMWRDLQDGLTGMVQGDSFSLSRFRDLPEVLASLVLWEMAGRPRKGFAEFEKTAKQLKRMRKGSHLLPGGRRMECDGETIRVTCRGFGRY